MEDASFIGRGDSTVRLARDTATEPFDERKNILVSYHYFGKFDFAAMVREFYPEPFPRIFLDSGAWSAFTSGVKVDLDKYIRFCHDNAAVIWRYSNLDNMANGKKTLANQVEMERQGLDPIPTFHTGDEWSLFEDYCARYTYVALGKIIPYTNRPEVIVPWITKAFRIAGDATRLHGFGVSNVHLMKMFPWATCDSSSWTSAFRFGSIPLWDEAAATLRIVDTSDKRSFYAQNRALFNEHGYERWPILNRNTYNLRHAGPMGAVAYIKMSNWLARAHEKPFALFLANTRYDLMFTAEAYRFLFGDEERPGHFERAAGIARAA